MIELFLDHLFPGFSVGGKGMFRILRDSEDVYKRQRSRGLAN